MSVTLNLIVDLNDLMFEVRAIDKVARHLILVVVEVQVVHTCGPVLVFTSLSPKYRS